MVSLPEVPRFEALPDLVDVKSGLVVRGKIVAVAGRTIVIREPGGGPAPLLAIATSGLVGCKLRPVRAGHGCNAKGTPDVAPSSADGHAGVAVADVRPVQLDLLAA